MTFLLFFIWQTVQAANTGCGFTTTITLEYGAVETLKVTDLTLSPLCSFFLSPLTLICWLSPCRERLVSSLITDCLCTFFFWTPLQQTSHPFNQQHVSALLVLFTVFIARVYATCFLLCCGSMPNCSMIGPYDGYEEDWIMMYAFTSESMSWCAWMSRLLFLQDLRFKTGINMSFNRDFFPPRSLLYSKCFHQWLGVIFPVYSGELSHRRGLHLGDKPDHCTERVFVRACPTHVLLGTFLLPLQPRPLCQCLGLSGQDDQMSWPLFPSVPSEDPQTH